MAGISEPTHAELARLVGAARAAGGISRVSNFRFIIAVAAFLATLSIFPHATRGRAFLPSPIVGAVSPAPSIGRPPEESPAMRAAGLAVVVSVGVVSGVVNAQDAVQWRVEDGGNGHWYELVVMTGGIDWSTARAQSLVRGGGLASATSLAECEFLFDISRVEAAWTQNRYIGPWLGGRQSSAVPGFSEPSGGWSWDSGERWSFSNWDRYNPSNGPSGTEDFLHMSGYSPTWNDIRGDGEGNVCSYIIEWSADCNADGIVDYGQILTGELADANGNNIPDCCENGESCEPCPADLDASGAVNGVDLAIILNTWGTAGGKYPQADIDGDGVVSGTDLALILGAWGECP